MKKKIIAFILIIGSITFLITSHFFIKNKMDNLNNNFKKIQKEIFTSQKEKRLITSYIETKEAVLELKLVIGDAVVFFFIIGAILLLYDKIQMIEKYIKEKSIN